MMYKNCINQKLDSGHINSFLAHKSTWKGSSPGGHMVNYYTVEHSLHTLGGPYESQILGHSQKFHRPTKAAIVFLLKNS